MRCPMSRQGAHLRTYLSLLHRQAGHSRWAAIKSTQKGKSRHISALVIMFSGLEPTTSCKFAANCCAVASCSAKLHSLVQIDKSHPIHPRKEEKKKVCTGPSQLCGPHVCIACDLFQKQYATMCWMVYVRCTTSDACLAGKAR